MSADAPRRSTRTGGLLIRPQPVSDKSVMETVVDFFQDVTSYGQSASAKPDDREKVQWVRFDQSDINDLANNPDYSGNQPAPLLLFIGYTNGIQIWAVPVSGEAQEVLSLRQGPVKFVKVLPTPETVFGRSDLYKKKRPLLALCDAASAGRPFCQVKIWSLKDSEPLTTLDFEHSLVDLRCNSRVVAAVCADYIRVLDACQFKELFRVTSCFHSPGLNPNPVALGSRWLAYADKKLVAVHQSCGGMTGDGGQTYAATVISAAKTLTKGLVMFSDTVTSTLTGSKSHLSHMRREPAYDPQVAGTSGARPGIVTIIDVMNVKRGSMHVADDSCSEGLVAHFPAHATEPVTALEFDPSGALLLTTDRLGHNFHLFRIMAHPISCSLGAVHHLYTLYRGDTTAKVQDICFSVDSRWVAVSTLRGTTHVFPLTPYGGPVTARTHTSPCVVNRASRFHRSAGIEDMTPRAAARQHTASGRDSPVGGPGSPGSSPRHDNIRHHLLHQNAFNNSQLSNPRLPPYPHPTTVYPVVQVRQASVIPGLGGATGGAAQKHAKGPQQTGQALQDTDSICVAACFARSRGWLPPNNKPDEKAWVDSLFLINKVGDLVEYVLDPQVKTGIEKPTGDSPIEVLHSPRAQWSLLRGKLGAELRPPLHSGNALMMASAAVGDRTPSAELSGSLSSRVRHESKESLSSDQSSETDSGSSGGDQWLSQVEIITHSGPHRRLWMGPQFSFKTFQGSQTTTVFPSNSSVLLSASPETSHVSTLDMGDDLDLQSLKLNPARSSPMAMPRSSKRSTDSSGHSAAAPTYIEADIAVDDGSYTESPYIDCYPSLTPAPGGELGGDVADDQLREDIADAMNEVAPPRDHHHHHHHHGPLSRHHREDLGHTQSLELKINDEPRVQFPIEQINGELICTEEKIPLQDELHVLQHPEHKLQLDLKLQETLEPTIQEPPKHKAVKHTLNKVHEPDLLIELEHKIEEPLERKAKASSKKKVQEPDLLIEEAGHKIQEPAIESPEKQSPGESAIQSPEIQSPEMDHGSFETLSTSSGSASSSTRTHSFDARNSPPHSIEHVLVFPSNCGSADDT